jgi:hypothetical protein
VTSCRNQTRLGTFIAGNGQVNSPSGPQVFKDGTSEWLVYDGLPGGSCPGTGDCTGGRTFRIDKLCYAHGQPRTNAPSAGSQTQTRMPICSNGIPGAPFNPSYTDTGATVTNATLRDGGSFTAVGGRTLWFFGDSGKPGCPNQVNNSGAMGVPSVSAPNVPNWIDEPGCPHQLIPYTADEAAFSKGINTCTNYDCGPVDDQGTGAGHIPAASIASGTPRSAAIPRCRPGPATPTACSPPEPPLRTRRSSASPSSTAGSSTSTPPPARSASSYNPYLDVFVNVSTLLGHVLVQTAPALTGPWTPWQHFELSSCQDASFYAYSVYPHAELSMNGGRTLDITYLRPGNPNTGCAEQFRWGTLVLG